MLAWWCERVFCERTGLVDGDRGSVLQGLRPSWYRFTTTFRHRSSGYLAVVLLIGLVGGLAMASVAAARRTASSPSVVFASTNPSDLAGATAAVNPLIGDSTGYNQSVTRAIARIPHVKRVESYSGIDFLPLQRNGLPLNAPNFYQPSAGNGYGSINGLAFDEDKVIVTKGRMADPRRADELMLTAQGASALFVHVGSTLPVGIYTNAQTQLPGFGTAAVSPIRVIDEKVVGIFVDASTIVHDDADAGSGTNNVFTPALTRTLLGCCVNYTVTGLQVEGGSRNVAKVAAEISSALPIGVPPFASLRPQLAKAQRAVEPEALALGVFGGIVALAALLIAGQVIGRQLRFDADDRVVLRGLGAGPAVTVTDGLIGMLGAVVAGAVLAGATAVGLSPLSPLGPFRPEYPHPGVGFDWTVLGSGMALLVVGLAAFTVVMAERYAPHRFPRLLWDADRPSRLVTAVAGSDLPTPAVTGIRFALQPGSGRRAVPVRSAIFGAVLAVVVIIATVTFGASLDSLVSHPSFYGWNWDYMLVSGADIPEQQVATLLDHDRYVSQWSGVYTVPLDLGGQSVPVLGESPGAEVGPPTLSGHGLDASDQVVLGATTLADLHKHVGDAVTLTSAQPAQRLRIVGTAAMPAIGGSVGPLHTEMGTGALIDYRLIPAVDRNPFANPLTGPNAIFVRVRPGLSRSAAERSLARIAQATSNTANFGVTVTGVLRPAEIVNYRSLGDTPLFLGLGLAGGAVAALALTLVTSVRRRQSDLAVLKTLGFTSGQVTSTIAWQATVAVGLGTVIGLPLGIGLGRWLWDVFARDIHAVPAPAVPAGIVAGIAVGALVLANVVAFLPGRLAARTPVASLLHSE